ncbi:hypothetical protein DENSPDRAFT_840611 [Dentipellis sp. KUC8613]|nr:hypothetical protein DENSPDRAFT_840611 [Dentipellis sp. KUC8613]
MPSHVALGPVARAAKQCQRCFKSEVEVGHLLSCGGCHSAHYCNKECQTIDWPNHKPLCKINRDTRAHVKALTASEVADSSSSVRVGPSLLDIEDALKPWRQIHRPMVVWAHSQALDLYHHPKNVDKQILVLKLTPAFTERPPRTADQAKTFHLEFAEVMSYEDAIEDWKDLPVYQPLITQLGPIQALSQRIQGQGGTGVGLVVLLIARRCVHVMPCGHPDDLTTSPQLYRPDWEERLADIFRRGIRI